MHDFETIGSEICPGLCYLTVSVVIQYKQVHFDNCSCCRLLSNYEHPVHVYIHIHTYTYIPGIYTYEVPELGIVFASAHNDFQTTSRSYDRTSSPSGYRRRLSVSMSVSISRLGKKKWNILYRARWDLEIPCGPHRKKLLSLYQSAAHGCRYTLLIKETGKAGKRGAWHMTRDALRTSKRVGSSWGESFGVGQLQAIRSANNAKSTTMMYTLVPGT